MYSDDILAFLFSELMNFVSASMRQICSDNFQELGDQAEALNHIIKDLLFFSPM
jgi:hypothetical protein